MSNLPILEYAKAYQTLELRIQSALEGIKVKTLNDEVVGLDQALLELAKAYGTHNRQAVERTQRAANFLSMFEAFKQATFTTPEARNEFLKKVHKAAVTAEEQREEREWENRVLAEARLKRAESVEAEEEDSSTEEEE